jgi:hypothetical protein
MSKKEKRDVDEAGTDLPVTKRAAATKTASAFFAQYYDSHAKEMNPWQYIDRQSYRMELSKEHQIGINISTHAHGATEHVTIVPYGPKEIKCTTRDGCGGFMEKGQALDWACNALLRVECVLSPFLTFRAVVIIVHLNSQDGPINIEQAVRDIFNVDGDMHVPCWLPASIADNYRQSWKEAAERVTASYELLERKAKETQELLEQKAKETQEKLQSELTDAKEQLKKYDAVIDEIQELAKCSHCKTLVSKKAPCQLGRCGHWVCTKCLYDYFHGLGNSTPFCGMCKDEVPRLTWQPFYALTGVSAQIQKVRPQEEAEAITPAQTAYLVRPYSP